MSYTRRGLSDVVTTVLIILLVVIAVVAIGAYVRQSVDQTGKTLERATTCSVNQIDVTSCRYALNGSAYDVTLVTKRTSDDASVASVSALKASLTNADGSVNTIGAPSGAIPSANAVPASGVLVATKQPAQVSVTAEFTLKNGDKVTCAGASAPCSA